nr:ribonuclease H-like domain, reverse transcriptase, RNA-dependent DNA polymerase [Tanacetum cinerariifolium]
MTGKKNKEIGSATSFQCPMLNNSNFNIWAIRMQVILEATDLWEVVELQTTTQIDNRADKTAISFIFQALPEDQILQVAKHKSARTVWDALKTRHVGENRVQQAKQQTLKAEFEALQMKENESVESFISKISKEDQSNLIEEDLEPTLVMATIEEHHEVFLNERNFEPPKTSPGEESLWYLDNGARNHMTGVKEHFKEIEEKITGNIGFGDGSYVEIKGKGYILLECKNKEQRAISQDQAFSVFKELKTRAEKEHGTKIKMFRIDRGGEFTSNEFHKYCRENGIIRQLTAPYSPQQNGVVKRKNRTILSTTRCMMKATGMPQNFWAEAVRHAILLLNCTPTKSLEDVTPYEALKGTKPNLQHIKIFGCIAYAKVYDNTEILLLVEDEPKNFKEVLKDEKWIEAMQVEINCINKNNTWKLTTLPKDHKAIGLKWVFKTKRDANEEILKHKARLVAKGYIQEHGIDFDEVFALVARIETIRLILALAAYNKWEVHHLDVKSAFLHGDLKVYVDDLIVTGTSKKEIKSFKYQMQEQFKMSDLGLLAYYLGIEKQGIIALSSCESEFITATAIATQALWLKRLLSKITDSNKEKNTIYVDNKSAIALMKNPVFHGRSKHIDTKYHFIQECVEKEDLTVEHINGEQQRADILTKALPRIRFVTMRQILGVKNLLQHDQD